MLNSIVYFNHDHQNQILGSASVTYSDIQGGFVGDGVIDFNPIFDDQYQIASGSPAVDAGDPAPQFAEHSFPPSLGSIRCDMGIGGGPEAALWNARVSPQPREMLRIEPRFVFQWVHRDNIRVEHAVDVRGPWYPYTGEIITIGAKRAALISYTEPRRFLRLVEAAQ